MEMYISATVFQQIVDNIYIPFQYGFCKYGDGDGSEHRIDGSIDVGTDTIIFVFLDELLYTRQITRSDGVTQIMDDTLLIRFRR